MNSTRRRSSRPSRSTSSLTYGGVARGIEASSAAAIARSNGDGQTPAVTFPALPPRSAHCSPTRDIVPAALPPGPDLEHREPDPAAGHVVAQHALERALRLVPQTKLLVAGSRSDAVVRWLRSCGRDAEPLGPGLRTDVRERPRSRSARPGVVLAADLAGSDGDGARFFGGIRRVLAADGLLIAVVPNLTHARTRIAMLLGRYAARSSSAGPSYTLTELERVLEDAAFTIIEVERQVDPVDSLRAAAAGAPEPVIDLLARDLDAMTSHFVVLAEPRSSSSVSRCHRRLGEIAEAHRLTARDVERLEDRVAELDVRVRHCGTEVDRLALREASPPAAERSPAEERIEHEVRSLAERLGVDRTRESERDAALNAARESLSKRAGEIRALTARIERTRYRRVVLRIRQVVSQEVPRGSIVAVISRGDPELLALEGRKGWHFPQTARGVYAGHHPADSKAAIGHLEELRARGAQYLVVPRTAFWWLEHYREFGQYLQRRCRCAWRDDRTCVVFALGGGWAVR